MTRGRTWILPPGAVVPNPKSETRNPKQIQMPNDPRPRTASRAVVWVIPCLVLGVCFGLRGSGFRALDGGSSKMHPTCGKDYFGVLGAAEPQLSRRAGAPFDRVPAFITRSEEHT